MSEPTVEPYRPFPSFDAFNVPNFNSTAYDLFAVRLDAARTSADRTQLEAAVEKATRTAAVDTGAIEGLYQVDRGFTMTVAAEAAAWENIHEVRGETVARAMNDALNGYQYVMDLVTQSKPISEAWIRELHSVLCASQGTYKVMTSQGQQEQTLPLGAYKEHPNNPRNLKTSIVHSYAPVTDTPAEMQRLTDQLTSEGFRDAHPIIQAAYAHYAFVCIHPFADGNGRVARALASVYLYRSPGVPLVIFADQKGDYLDALELADSGLYDGFVSFVGDRALDTVRMVLTDLRSAVPRDRRESRVQQLQAALLGKGGLSHTEIDALGVLLVQETLKAFQQAREDSPPPAPIQIRLTHDPGISLINPPEGFRTVPGGGQLTISAHTPAPMDVSIAEAITAFIAKPEHTESDFVVATSKEILGEFFLRDLHPTVSGTTMYTLRAIADERLWRITETAAARAEQVLTQKGYR